MSLVKTATINLRRTIILFSSLLCFYISFDILSYISEYRKVGAVFIFFLMFSAGGAFFRYFLDTYSKLSLDNTTIEIRTLFKTYSFSQHELSRVSSIRNDSLFIEKKDDILHLYSFSNNYFEGFIEEVSSSSIYEEIKSLNIKRLTSYHRIEIALSATLTSIVHLA